MMQHQTGTQPVSLMCVAAPTDSILLDQWETQLLPLTHAGLITIWSEHDLQAGANRMEELFAQLEQAAYIVLFLSADFFANDLCLTIMERGLQRHREDDVPLIPLLVRPVAWQDTPLGMLTCLPANGVPITTWEHPDEGWLSAVQGVRRRLSRVASHTMTPVGKRASTDRERMLHRLRRTYQASLDDSLQGIAWMELGLTEHPDAVRNATHLLQRLPDRTERILPVGTRVLSAYEQAEEELLILGAPGAGKSMLLLDLAQQLIARAEADATHPLPVIVPLSSWAVSKAKIVEWLVEQLARIYEVPLKLSQAWVEQDLVFPLLDGLDEMEETARPLCIAAINAYHAEHLAPLVVCSRQAEYEVAASREHLSLQNAVIVQPLTKVQMTDMLQRCGPDLAALYEVFTERSTVRDLATTPLMLSVLMLTYRGTPIGDLPQQQDRLEERVWTDYVERMVRTKGDNFQRSTDVPEKRYPLAQTCTSLSWLAQQMRMHNQTLFYGEYLQENWLPAAQQRAANWLLVRLPAMLLGSLTSLLLVLFIVSSTIDRATLCQMGLVGGFLGWCLSQEKSRGLTAVSLSEPKLERMRQLYLPRLSTAILLGFLSAATWGLNLSYDYPMSEWFRDGIITGITIGVSAWLFQSRLARMMLSSDHLPPRSTNGWWRRFGRMQMIHGRRAILAGVLFGIGIVLSTGLSTGLSDGLRFGSSAGLSTGLGFGLSTGLSAGLGYGLLYGLSVGGATLLVSLILGVQTGGVRLAERIHWSGRTFVRWHHLRTSLLIALACFCVFGLSIGLSYGLSQALAVGLIDPLSHGPDYGMVYGVTIGLDSPLSYALSAGLSIGLSVGLSYWVLVGLYQGITQEHLSDQDRRQFNQGLHRSLRNGALLGLLSAGISTGITLGLSYGLSTGLRAGMGYGLLSAGLSIGLDYALSAGLSIGWLLALCGWLVAWAATGGLTILRHYLLRLLLARSRTFPWQARRFLDDATARVLLRRVGGSYGFVHRRLLDYFAARPTLAGEEDQ